MRFVNFRFGATRNLQRGMLMLEFMFYCCYLGFGDGGNIRNHGGINVVELEMILKNFS